MATRKNNASKTVLTSSAPIASKSRKGRTARSASRVVPDFVGRTGRGNRGFDIAKFVGPGAAVLATGALAAAGYAFKEQLADVMVDVLKTATKQGSKAASVTSKAMDTARDQAMDAVEKISDKVSMDAFLRYAGLQRKSTFMSIMGPAFGVACGFAAGSAVAYFFGPKLLEQLKDKSLPFAQAMKEGSSEEGSSEPMETDDEDASSTSPTTEGMRVNGGLHRGVS